MKKQRVAVRTLVETILLSGSISPVASAQRMLEGAEAHRALQSVPAEGAQNEVVVSGTVCSENITLLVYGRIDRLYGESCIEEMKTTYASEESLHGGKAQHWAQAKCYAYLFCKKNNIAQIDVRLTYFHLGTGEVFYFTQSETQEALASFFTDLTGRYLARLEADYAHACTLRDAVRTMPFPYETFRDGQHALASQVYYAVYKKTALMAQAPTGTGKTMAVLFPALKAMGEGHAEKIFYLTARTTQQDAAVAAVTLLAIPELRCVVLSAKEKMCIHPHPICREGMCACAEGYYDRLNGALDEVCRTGGLYTREAIRRLAARHFLCPFELSLDLSSVCDAIIGDYNYAFDPRVRLQRFFTQRKNPYVLLVDEAHNLPDRARGMYTAALALIDVAGVRRSVPRQHRKSPLYRSLTRLMGAIADCFSEREIPGASESAPEQLLPDVEEAIANLSAEEVHADTEQARQLLFSLSAFQYILRQYDESYLTLYEGGKTTRRITLFCADAADRLAEVYKKCRSEVLFSATLTPHTFYRNLCGLSEGAAMLALPSPFPPENLAVLHMPVDTRYKARMQTMGEVADAIAAFALARENGNYLVFLPSHAYLAAVHPMLTERLPSAHLFTQQTEMDDAERAAFLSQLQPNPSGVTVGLAVMGGVFAEGIDLPDDRLCGAVVVGVGLPQLCLSRDVLKAVYARKYEDGYRYAYLYPGIGKVLQAAGRIIRTESDRGALLLLDSRYGSAEYRALLPAAWKPQLVKSADAIRAALTAFWEGERDG